MIQLAGALIGMAGAAGAGLFYLSDKQNLVSLCFIPILVGPLVFVVGQVVKKKD
jgi:hypothetical protein